MSVTSTIVSARRIYRHLLFILELVFSTIGLKRNEMNKGIKPIIQNVLRLFEVNKLRWTHMATLVSIKHTLVVLKMFLCTFRIIRAALKLGIACTSQQGVLLSIGSNKVPVLSALTVCISLQGSQRSFGQLVTSWGPPLRPFVHFPDKHSYREKIAHGHPLAVQQQRWLDYSAEQTKEQRRRKELVSYSLKGLGRRSA